MVEKELSEEELGKIPLDELANYTKSAVLILKDKAGTIQVYQHGEIFELVGHMFLGAFSLSHKIYEEKERKTALSELLNIVKNPNTRVEAVKISSEKECDGCGDCEEDKKDLQ